MRVIKRQCYRFNSFGPLDAKCFVLHAEVAPFTLVKVLQGAVRIDLLLVNITDVWLVPGGRPRDFVVESGEKERAPEPTDAAHIQFAWRDQVSLVLLEAIGPWHVQVFDVNDSSGGRLRRQDRPLVGTEIGKRVGATRELRERVADAIKAHVLAALQG